MDSTFETHLNSLTLWLTTFKDEKKFWGQKRAQKHVGMEKGIKVKKAQSQGYFSKITLLWWMLPFMCFSGIVDDQYHVCF